MLSGKVVNLLYLTEIIEIEIFCAKILKDFNSDEFLFFLQRSIEGISCFNDRPSEKSQQNLLLRLSIGHYTHTVPGIQSISIFSPYSIFRIKIRNKRTLTDHDVEFQLDISLPQYPGISEQLKCKRP